MGLENAKRTLLGYEEISEHDYLVTSDAYLLACKVDGLGLAVS